jgi:hypothetical protein
MKNLSYTKKGPGRTHNYNRKKRTVEQFTFEDQDGPDFSKEDHEEHTPIAQKVITASRNVMKSVHSFVREVFK